MKQLLTAAERSTYHAPDGAISATALKAACKSMLEMRAAMTRTSGEPTPAMVRGTNVHMAVLQTELWNSSVAVYEGGARRGKEWDAFSAANEGKIILKPDEFSEVDEVAAAVLANKLAASLLAKCDTEVERRWDGADGIGACKALIDGVSKDGLFFFDLKTCADIDAFRRGFFGRSLNYDIQFAWYWNALKRGAVAYVIAVETAEPWDVAVWQIPQPVLAHAAAKAERLARQYRQCEADGQFPGVVGQSATITELEPPAWYFEDGEEVGGFPGLDPSAL